MLPSAIADLFPADARDALVTLRRDLHEHPELSFAERRTCERLHAALAPLDTRRLDRVAETGLVARIRGRDPAAPLVDVRAIFGGHVDRRFAVGQVVAEAGPLAAAADTFRIELTGRGGHGARPQEGADPIVAAAALVGALQTIVSRRLDPARAAVVTVGTIHAGSAPNVIPDSAVLEGTLRAVDADTRQTLHEEMRRLTGTLAGAYGVSARVAIDLGPPPIVNPPEAAAWARTATVAVLGQQALTPLGTLNMGGEDFAYYMERIPGCFLRIGAREAGGEPIPAHSARFYAAEESLFIGAAVLAETARVASKAVTAGA